MPISGRLTYLVRQGATAAVFVTEGNVFEAMRRARGWPGARSAILDYVWYPASGAPAPSGPFVLTVLPLASGPPVPFDGEVQVQPGDVITVTYDGGGPALVQSTIVVP